ncbi:hypothetical protein LTR37_011104 [Vermiconidia calcicola]|uniref:Uncharacterized protein n=1 Tax=Vermiconidia calcicola TaxID=1690605 RepID=A0ACC3N4D3_9PEZI|nr:hypothetical protein LTR37_011104 [Vermiconidia calcicola]
MADLSQTQNILSLNASLISGEDIAIYTEFLHEAWQNHTHGSSELLQSIPRSSSDSYAPLATFSALLSAIPGPWPVLELQRTYTEIWRLLPEDAKAGRATPHGQQLLEHSFRRCTQSYSSILDLLQEDSRETAVIDPENNRCISHKALSAAIRAFNLPVRTDLEQLKPVVAISLPNGPLLATTVLATATYYTAAPLAYGSGVGSEQFRRDVLQSKASLVLASPSDVSRLGLHDCWLADAGIEVLLIDLTADMHLVLRDLDGKALPDDPKLARPVPNDANDTGILLFTSGTSGTKKLVPLTVHSMICGVAMVVESWGLGPSMRCLNQMPLNHVGGLIRNLFAPIMSGGSVICCSAFDANLFWDCVEDYAPTWYYASPSMHQCILEAGSERPGAMTKSHIRLVCNAAGGLLPSLACQLRDAFGCTVLPSYGMTECMPISTPPLDYRLDKPGTSGISVGPEISILDSQDARVSSGIVGHIVVRGSPVFGGYLKASGVVDKSCFKANGWFDTGDMGYLDNEGYLFITGRSKEVINRGGELISPFEVEEAIVAAANVPNSPTYGRIGKALAFSVMHDVLQEVVGICVVTPPGAKRACLRKIQASVKNRLSQVKIPTVVVYMDANLPNNNNKVLRIKLADRLGLPELSDDTSEDQRHYEAVCPPPNTALTETIACRQLPIKHDQLFAACRRLLPQDVDVHCTKLHLYPELFLAPSINANAMPLRVNADDLVHRLENQLDGYQLPVKVHVLQQPFPKSPSGTVDEAALDNMLETPSTLAEPSSHLSPTETTVARILSQILSISRNDLTGASDFFGLGGDSMKAGRLLSLLRKEFQIRFSIDLLFANSTVTALAWLIDEKLNDTKPSDTTTVPSTIPADEAILPGCDKTHSSSTAPVLLLQLLPLCLFYPAKRAFTWTIFIYCLSYTLHMITNEIIPGRLFNLVVAMFVARIATQTLAPATAIGFKWALVGRYKEGLYPMWGLYHTRWWLCQKAVQVAGMGTWGMFNWSRCLYYRALGVKIGKNVTLNKGAILGEYDLLTIEDGVVLERCIVRPFAVERNTSMYLGRIRLGSNSSIGLGSIVAAGTSLSPNTCIGPNSSNWEADDADEANRDLASSKITGAHWALNLLLSLPLQALSAFVGALPWLGCLVALVNHEPQGLYADALRNISLWFASPDRVGLHYAAMAANAALGPVFFFAAVFIIKNCFDFCCGQLRSGDASSFSQMTKFRRQLTRTLMPAPRLHKLTELFGTHYESTSIFMRAMGAKVGKRVYWPGTGPSIQDFDLIEVGDDVVFGSRSHLVTSDGTGSEPICMNSGAMVADRVVLLPGVELGKKAVMGSGALTRRNVQYPAGTTWVGSKKGECLCLTTPNDGAEEKTLSVPSSNFASYNSSSTTLAASLKESQLYNPSALEQGGCLRGYEDFNIEAIREKLDDAEQMSLRSKDQTDAMKSGPSSSPFGRAFYQGSAPYRVWSQFEIFIYSTLITIATAVYWNIGSISANQIIAHIFKHGNGYLARVILAPDAWFRPLNYYLIFLLLTILITVLQSIVVLLFLIAAKWILMGKRKPGCYSWDESPYCQRWQLYLKLESLRRNCYGGNGILGLLTGTHWMVLYFRALGATVGKDCALFAGGEPSLMFTEPDLLTLGNRVSVDDASLVCHINTRGKFDLNPLHVGDRSVLRSGSRLLSGAKMEEDTCLLEHTLVMAGDVVDAGSTYQGWPAEEFRGSRMPTMKAKLGWAKAEV